jgi:hypothetical protein
MRFLRLTMILDGRKELRNHAEIPPVPSNNAETVEV